MAPSSDDFTAGKKPFRALTKYSYAESGTTLVKVLLSELDQMKDHPADKMKIEFSERSFSVLVADYKGVAGNNIRFAVPKLQCKIIPKGCSYVFKSSGL